MRKFLCKTQQSIFFIFPKNLWFEIPIRCEFSFKIMISRYENLYYFYGPPTSNKTTNGPRKWKITRQSSWELKADTLCLFMREALKTDYENFPTWQTLQIFIITKGNREVSFTLWMKCSKEIFYLKELQTKCTIFHSQRVVFSYWALVKIKRKKRFTLS